MILIDSFSFFKNNFDLLKKLNHKQPKFYILIIPIILHIVVFLGFDKIMYFVLKKSLSKRIIKSPVVVFIFGTNHARVLAQLQDNSFDFPVYNFDDKLDKKILYQEQTTIGVFFLVTGILANSKEFIRSWNKGKKINFIKSNFFRLLKTAGYQPIFEELLKHCRVVVKFNDHNPYHNLLFKQAQKSNIKTVYIQHAPVSYKFPPLHHDLNVLFSKDSLSKYKQLYDYCKIRVLFDIRFLGGFSKLNMQPPNNSILIAFNKLDNLNSLIELVTYLSKTHTIIVRPHPADIRNFHFFKKIKGVTISQSVSIWEDLSRTSALICNETAVPLESIFLNRPVYKAAFLSESFDNYGFIEKGLLTKEFHTIDDLVSAICSNENCVNKEHLDYFIGNFADYKLKIKSLYNEILHLGS